VREYSQTADRRNCNMYSISLSTGNKLAGRYRVLQKLGEGTFAETFLAVDEHLPNSFHCVIKKLKTVVEDDSRFNIAKRLFDEEARTLHQLGSHPNIPQLLAHFEEDNEFYLVEEYIVGTSLYHELAKGQEWSESYATKLLKDILGTLSFIHQKQVIHRDLKPSNIIRRERDGQIVLIDFGAVKQVTHQVLDENSQVAPHTVIIGTPGYMPSEQLRGSPRRSSDVYAVGMIGIYALTGLNPELERLPEDETTAEILWQDKASVSPGLTLILEKMVAYDFRQRYPSATETLDALKTLKHHNRQEDTPTRLREASGSIRASENCGVSVKPDRMVILKSGIYSNSSRRGIINSNNTALRKFSPKLLALGSAVVLGVGAITAVASPSFEPICIALNNCSANVKYGKVYREARNSAEAALKAINSSKTLKDLQSAQDRLQSSIGQIHHVPKGVDSYSEAQKLLPNYQKRLHAVGEHITSKKKAQENMQQAEKLANQVKTQKQIPTSTQALSDNQATLDKTTQGKNQIPDKSLSAPQKEANKKAYIAKPKEINTALDKQIINEQQAIQHEPPAPASLDPLPTQPPWDEGRTSTANQPPSELNPSPSKAAPASLDPLPTPPLWDEGNAFSSH
jgi:serine/threonine protein kinase